MRPYLLLAIFLGHALFGFCQGDDSSLKAAHIQYSQGNFARVEAICKSYLKSHEKDAEAWLLLGDCLQKQEAIPQSLRAYNKCLSIDPNNAQALIDRGSAYITSHEYEKAEKDLDEGTTLDPLNGRGYYFLGNAEYFLLKLGKAQRAYEKSVKLDPEYAPSFYMLAATKAERGNTAAAEDDYRHVLALDSSLKIAKYQLGVLAYQAGDYKSAMTLMDEVSAQDIPNTKDYYFFKAESHYFAGDQQNACADYQKAAAHGDKEAEQIYQKYCLTGEKRDKPAERKVTRVTL